MQAARYSYTSDNRITPESGLNFHFFYQSPIDFGNLSIISARTGLTVFEGTTIWMGTGQVETLAQWLDASEAASGCSLSTQITIPAFVDFSPPSLGYKTALKNLWETTAIPMALSNTDNILQDGAVYPYAPRVGMFDPSVAEWVILLNSERGFSISSTPSMSGPIEHRK